MKKSDLIRHVEEMTDAPTGSLKEIDKLTDIGWESISVLEFQSLLEVEFDRRPSLNQLIACKTVGDLIALAGLDLQD